MVEITTSTSRFGGAAVLVCRPVRSRVNPFAARRRFAPRVVLHPAHPPTLGGGNLERQQNLQRRADGCALNKDPHQPLPCRARGRAAKRFGVLRSGSRKCASGIENSALICPPPLRSFGGGNLVRGRGRARQVGGYGGPPHFGGIRQVAHGHRIFNRARNESHAEQGPSPSSPSQESFAKLRIRELPVGGVGSMNLKLLKAELWKS
jgi:hypothetical protein